MHLYASYGQGFQTPLGSELAYRSDGGSGLNPLKAAYNTSNELGAKLQFSERFTGEVATFQTRTRDEIVVKTNAGGRPTYQNAGRTRRSGAELSLNYRFAESWRTQLAYTYVDATYTDAYLTCTVTPCPTSNTPIPAGNRLPGVPKSNVYANVRWGGELGWQVTANGQYVSGIPVNDVNSVFTPSYAVFGLSGGYGADLPAFRLNAFVRLNNLFDRAYVGSVIINEGNQRFFEPGLGRNVLAGFNITLK
jgi:iron complex outermembrane receptor protein